MRAIARWCGSPEKPAHSRTPLRRPAAARIDTAHAVVENVCTPPEIASPVRRPERGVSICSSWLRMTNHAGDPISGPTPAARGHPFFLRCAAARATRAHASPHNRSNARPTRCMSAVASCPSGLRMSRASRVKSLHRTTDGAGKPALARSSMAQSSGQETWGLT